MPNFQHFLITRFNVKTDFGASAGLNPEWLKHRFALFERFCYPSVRAQFNQNFKWLVYFDADTPEVFKARIREYAEWQNFIPAYLSEQFTVEASRSFILEHLDQQAEFLITTRLDNDDAVHKEFIGFIQNSFSQQKMQFINLPNGYVWNDGKLYSFQYSNNPFVSLIERIESRTVNGFHTVLCASHTQVASSGCLKQVKTEPGWLQVVHDRNIANRVRGIRQPLTKLEGNFLIAENIDLHRNDIVSYYLDKAFSILKYPLNEIAIRLPDNLKKSIKGLMSSRAS